MSLNMSYALWQDRGTNGNSGSMLVMYSWRTWSASTKVISNPETMEIEPDRGGNDASEG